MTWSLSQEVANRLQTRRLGRTLRHLAIVGSTNDEAAAWARAGAPEGATVVADTQWAGRGRFGRTWFSPPGANLYLSVVLRPTVGPAAVAPVTLAAGRAVFDLVAELGVAAELKWPNDVLVDGRKLSGILTEMSASGEGIEHLILGVGLNVNSEEFPPDLGDRATSLRRARLGASGPDLARGPVLAALLLHLEAAYDALLDRGPEDAVAAFRERWGGAGRRVRVRTGTGELRGLARAINDDGALVVEGEDGVCHQVRSGEVSDDADYDHR